MNDLLADVDTVIAIYFLDFVNRDDVGAMHSQKLFLWQHLLNGFHRQMGDQWFGLVVEIKHHIVFHAVDVGDLVDSHVAPFAINPDENSIGLLRLWGRGLLI